MAKPKPMVVTDDELVAKVNYERTLCNTQSESFLSDQRINSNYSFVNDNTIYTVPTTGMSGIRFFFTPSVVSTLVAYNSKIFCGDKETVQFNPMNQDPMVQAGAKQLAMAVNNVLHRKNNGFDIISELLRSAAVNKNSIAKVVWVEKPVAFEEELSDVSDQAVMQYIAEREAEGYDVEVVEQTTVMESVSEMVEDPMTGESVEIQVSDSSSDYTLRLSKMEGGIDVTILPPEEFLINEDTTSINNDELTRFVAHRREVYRADAQAMFPDADESEFGMADLTFYEQEKAARHAVDGTFTQYGDAGEASDQLMGKVEIMESWIRADRDGDGFSEWRHVFTSANNLLMDEEWFGPLPFASYTFFPIPHKFYGLSVYDRLRSYEEAATGLMRSELDTRRQQNTRQLIVRNSDATDAMRRFVQSGKPGVMPGGTTFDPKDIYAIPTPSGSNGTAFAMEELRKQVIGDIGIDPITGQISTDIEKSGNDAAKTAMALDNASIKTESYARRFADGCLKDIIWLITMELVRHKDDPYVIDLIQGLTPGDPFIAGEMGIDRVMEKSDLTARVGLGHQTGQQKIQASAAAMQMLQLLKQDPDPATYALLRESLKGFGYDNPEEVLGPMEFWNQKAAQQQQQQAQALQLQQQQVMIEQQKLALQTQQVTSEIQRRDATELMRTEAVVAKDSTQAELNQVKAVTEMRDQELKEWQAEQEVANPEVSFRG